jgi:hypothetical protein
LQVTAHDDSGHNHSAAAEHDVRLALDVSFAGDLVACILGLVLVLMITRGDRRFSRVVDDILTPTVSIYSALTDLLFTGRDMLGEYQGERVETNLRYDLAIGQIPRAGRTADRKRRERGSPSAMLFCIGRIVCTVCCMQ